MPRILITVPTWNEEVIIRRSLEKLDETVRKYLPGHEVTIEVADNGSTDATTGIVRSLVGARPASPMGDTGVAPTVSLLQIADQGKGLAIRRSWERHLDDADVLLFTDSDLAADLAVFPRMVGEILEGKADLVCGSRFLSESVVVRRVSREVASRMYRALQRLILRLPVQDAQCGLKAISVSAARELLPLCKEKGFLFDSELIAFAARSGKRVLEVPVSWVEHREPGRRSAVGVFRHGWLFLLGLAEIRARIRHAQPPPAPPR